MRDLVRLLAAIYCAVVGLRIDPAEARRVALVIGNSEYRVGPLQNPVNDAVAVADALERKLKFEKVILRRNLGVDAFRAALSAFARESVGAELGIVYFAGHGTEVGGRNFLIPIDATLGRANALDLEAIPLDTVLGQLDGVRKLKLVILDACRNNVFALPGAKRTVSRGLARIEPENNTLIAYAAKDGTTADDGPGRSHSPFTEALLAHIATPGVEVQLLFRRIRDDVMKATSHQAQPQQPHVYASLGSLELYLHGQTDTVAAAKPSVAPVAPPPPLSEAANEWSRVDKTSVAELETFARRHSGSPEADYARARLADLKKRETALATPPAPLVTPDPRRFPPPALDRDRIREELAHKLFSRSTMAQLDCDSLWYLRNSIFARRGYRFKTARGQGAFGTGGWTDNPQLSAAEQHNVTEIRAAETMNRCPV